jgi:hypothetical protein
MPLASDLLEARFSGVLRTMTRSRGIPPPLGVYRYYGWLEPRSGRVETEDICFG